LFFKIKKRSINCILFKHISCSRKKRKTFVVIEMAALGALNEFSDLWIREVVPDFDLDGCDVWPTAGTACEVVEAELKPVLSSLYQQVSRGKRAIEKFADHEWHQRVRQAGPLRNLLDDVKRSPHQIGDYASNAMLKMLEMAYTVLPQELPHDQFATFHLCEAPASFLFGLEQWIGKREKGEAAASRWRWWASSMWPWSPQAMQAPTSFIEQTFDHWLWGKHPAPEKKKVYKKDPVPGDLFHCGPTLVKEFLAQEPQGAYLVTADGGMDAKGHFDEQEKLNVGLLWRQLVVALLTLRPGGHLILKCYLNEGHPATAAVALVLKQHFTKVELVKPPSSRECNAEYYWVATQATFAEAADTEARRQRFEPWLHLPAITIEKAECWYQVASRWPEDFSTWWLRVHTAALGHQLHGLTRLAAVRHAGDLHEVRTLNSHWLDTFLPLPPLRFRLSPPSSASAAATSKNNRAPVERRPPMENIDQERFRPDNRHSQGFHAIDRDGVRERDGNAYRQHRYPERSQSSSSWTSSHIVNGHPHPLPYQSSASRSSRERDRYQSQSPSRDEEYDPEEPALVPSAQERPFDVRHSNASHSHVRHSRSRSPVRHQVILPQPTYAAVNLVERDLVVPSNVQSGAGGANFVQGWGYVHPSRQPQLDSSQTLQLLDQINKSMAVTVIADDALYEDL